MLPMVVEIADSCEDVRRPGVFVIVDPAAIRRWRDPNTVLLAVPELLCRIDRQAVNRSLVGTKCFVSTWQGPRAHAPSRSACVCTAALADTFGI
jgi:hypothetical protein